MSKDFPRFIEIDFTKATEHAMRVRRLYQQLEKHYHENVWTTEEDMLAFSTDVGVLGRLIHGLIKNVNLPLHLTILNFIVK